MEENIDSSAEDVKTEETEFKVSKEEYEKLKEIENNKSIALKKEREAMDELKSKLTDFEKKEAELAEKEKMKKGKYEEIIEEQKAKLEELSKKAEAYDEVIKNKETKTKKELEELIESVWSETIEEHNDILSELSDEKKIIYLKKMFEKKETFDNKTTDWDKIDTQSEYEKAKAAWDVTAMLRFVWK